MKPPIDPEFFAVGQAAGMTDEEIQADWDAYCEDLEKFYAETEKQQIENAPPQPDRAEEMKTFFTEPKQ